MKGVTTLRTDTLTRWKDVNSTKGILRGFVFEEKLNTFIIANVIGGRGQFESGKKINWFIWRQRNSGSATVVKMERQHSCGCFLIHVSTIKNLAHLQICRYGFVFPCALQLSALKPSEKLAQSTVYKYNQQH